MRAWSEKRQISRTFLAGDGFHRAAATVYVQYSTKGLVENLERQETHTLIRILDPYPRAGSSAACTKSLELTSEKKGPRTFSWTRSQQVTFCTSGRLRQATRHHSQAICNEAATFWHWLRTDKRQANEPLRQSPHTPHKNKHTAPRHRQRQHPTGK